MAICSNCGAQFEEQQAKCPYCGYIYEPGASREYMENLEDIRQDMDDLTELSQGVYHGEMKKSVKRLGIILLIACVIVLVIGLIIGGLFRLLSFEEDEEEIKAQLAWANEYSPMLDEWYEQENYDAILEFSYQQQEEENDYFYTWDHSYFISYYEMYHLCMEVRDLIRAGEKPDTYQIGDAIIYSMEYLFYLYEDIFTQDELARLDLFREEVEDFFYGELKFTPEEAQKLKELADDDGFLSYQACYEYAESIMDRY